jgi:hypothetical protein
MLHVRILVCILSIGPPSVACASTNPTTSWPTTVTSGAPKTPTTVVMDTTQVFVSNSNPNGSGMNPIDTEGVNMTTASQSTTSGTSSPTTSVTPATLLATEPEATAKTCHGVKDPQPGCGTDPAICILLFMMEDMSETFCRVLCGKCPAAIPEEPSAANGSGSSNESGSGSSIASGNESGSGSYAEEYTPSTPTPTDAVEDQTTKETPNPSAYSTTRPSAATRPSATATTTTTTTTTKTLVVTTTTPAQSLTQSAVTNDTGTDTQASAEDGVQIECSSTEKCSSGKGVIAIVIIAIILLLFGIGAFIYDKKPKTTTSAPTQEDPPKKSKLERQWSITPTAFENPAYTAGVINLSEDSDEETETKTDGDDRETETKTDGDDRGSPDGLDFDFSADGAGTDAMEVYEPKEGDSDAVLLRKSSLKDRSRLKKSLVSDVLTHAQAISQGMTEETFKEIDVDGDGNLTPAEISQWKARKQMEEDNAKLQTMLAKDIAQMSHADAMEQGMTEEQFNAIDVDGDGELTAAEISAWKVQSASAAEGYIPIVSKGEESSEGSDSDSDSDEELAL